MDYNDILMHHYSSSDFLCHHGIKGQKWGVRRFQNPDGTLTAEGKARYVFNSETNNVTKKATTNYDPFSEEELDEKTARIRGKLTSYEVKKCSELARSIYAKAVKEEPAITNDITNIVKAAGSKMYGLEHRLKQVTSLTAKIGSDAKKDGVRFEEAAKDIKDSVRYTAVTDTAKFKSSYEQIKKSLEEKGYSEVRCKNYFTKYRDGKVQHKAVQTTYRNKNGFEFEVQFQTPESQAAKELKIPLYEEARRKGTSRKRQAELERSMHELAERVPNPPGVFDIQSYDRTSRR